MENENNLVITEEDYQTKEDCLVPIHQELKVRSIEILTDQLMLKDKEISTLKK